MESFSFNNQIFKNLCFILAPYGRKQAQNKSADAGHLSEHDSFRHRAADTRIPPDFPCGPQPVPRAKLSDKKRDWLPRFAYNDL